MNQSFVYICPITSVFSQPAWPWLHRLFTATRRVGKILLVVSGKTVSDFLKIHTFLMFLFKTIFNENYKKLQALKLAFKSFSSKMSKLAIF